MPFLLRHPLGACHCSPIRWFITFTFRFVCPPVLFPRIGAHDFCLRHQSSLFLLQLFEKESSFRLLKPTWKRRMFDSSPVEVVGWITIVILTLKLSFDLSYLVFTTFFAKFFCLNLRKCGPWAGKKLVIEFHCALTSFVCDILVLLLCIVVTGATDGIGLGFVKQVKNKLQIDSIMNKQKTNSCPFSLQQPD